MAQQEQVPVASKTGQTISGVLTTTPNLEEKKRYDNVHRFKKNILSKPSFIAQTESEQDLFAAEDDEEDVICLYCNDLFRNSRSREKGGFCKSKKVYL
ncbi:unnamed protein product [Diabrotica balteata]|uniref:Uncharacterized protein n=1 Tax=Diabrotica balteata TaxID=107213 RepID=A0A9N9X6N8_DIABA|nr:unnamed protein product [Diabrotica balteata]